MLQAIEQLIGDDLRKVRQLVAQCVERQPPEIRDALGYYFSSGGKLLRPMLALLSARAAAGGALAPDRAQETVTFAAAVEFVHNASLVHDDIMDGDAVRRNLQTLHAKYGETCAVLLGDVLHITVFDLLAALNNGAVISMMTATIRDMCYGQLLDVRRQERTAADYEAIIRYKTGRLMATACVGGVLMSGAKLEQQNLQAAGDYGMQVGILYQMVDDYLDGDAGIELTPEHIGRVAGGSKLSLEVAFGDSPYRRQLEAFAGYFVGGMKSSRQPPAPAFQPRAVKAG
jgi:octaprenyl-diphosphate synthase